MHKTETLSKVKENVMPSIVDQIKEIGPYLNNIERAFKCASVINIQYIKNTIQTERLIIIIQTNHPFSVTSITLILKTEWLFFLSWCSLTVIFCIYFEQRVYFWSSVCCASAGVFVLLQVYAFLLYLKDRLTRQEFQTLFFLGVSVAAGVVFLSVIYLTYTGWFTLSLRR